MKIVQVHLYHLRMPLREPFVTGLGTVKEKDSIIVELTDEEGFVGWGECVAFMTPWYTEETIATCWHMMEDYLIPLLFRRTLEHPDDVAGIYASVRRNRMAKAGIEGAVWDLHAKRNDQSLAEALGGTRTTIEAGVAVGMQASKDELLDTISRYVSEGYRRIKVKIKPGEDISTIRTIRRRYPDLALMADANSAYTLDDISLLKELDDYDLLMIEQPLGYDDIVDHAVLQKEIRTPVCLDESIGSLDDARRAISLGSCSVINIKIGRVGGISEAIRIHDYCRAQGIPVWCGGMLETGIGRAHNIALASLDNFTLPGDISASSRYWERDIIYPDVKVINGHIFVPDKPGIGFEVDREMLAKETVSKKSFRNV